MAEKGALFNLVDLAKRLDPDGKVADIAEVLHQTNDVLTDLPWMEGNLVTGHRTTVRTGLPEPTWRRLNKGVAPTKGTTAQIEEACGLLEDRSEIDVKLAELGGNPNAVRLSEATAHLEGMSQEFADAFFYGNSGTAPQEITGLAPRYNSLAAENGENIVNAGGSQSDNTSIWLAVMGPRSLFGIYPKGTKAGIEHEDLEVGDAFDEDGNRFRAYMDRWAWNCGLCLKDWRFVVRIANIDVGSLSAKTAAADLIELMTKAIHRLPNAYASLRVGKPAFYMNRTIYQYLDLQSHEAVKAGGGMTYENVHGIEVQKFKQIPLRVVDRLHNAETVVS